MLPYLRGNLLTGVLNQISDNPLYWYSKYSHQHDILKINLGLFGSGYVLSHPDYIYHVFHQNQKNYRKSPFYKKMAPVVGNGLLLSEGDFWMRQRRLIQPSFRRKKIENSFSKIMVRNTKEMLKSWEGFAQKKTPVNLCKEMSYLTLRIVLESLFETSVEDDLAVVMGAWHSINDELGKRFWEPITPPKWFPSSRNRKFYQSLRVLEETIFRLIENERKNPSANLLTTFLQLTDADTGEKMTTQQIRDELITLFLAGHETSSNALSWTYYSLARNPSVAKKLQQEISSQLPSKELTVNDLENLPYNKMVIEEAMRLYPPAWAISRSAIDNDRVDNYDIPKGSIVFTSQYAMHQHPKYWEKPQQFYPEHFSEPKVKARPKFAYFPFGCGGRICIGNHFAMIEMQIILAMIAQKFRITMVKEKKIDVVPLTTLNPAEDIIVHLECI